MSAPSAAIPRNSSRICRVTVNLSSLGTGAVAGVASDLSLENNIICSNLPDLLWDAMQGVCAVHDGWKHGKLNKWKCQEYWSGGAAALSAATLC